jgi:hypothetical protein
MKTYNLIRAEFVIKITPFCILFFSSSYIARIFIKTEMVLKSKSVCSGNKQLVRSRSTDNLPTSQSQINIQMMSHTLTIREVSRHSTNA